MHTESIFSRRICQLIFALIFATMLSGCAGMNAFKEGKALLNQGRNEEGIAKLEEAVKKEPNNAEYGIALANYRTSIVNKLVSAGEGARRAGKLTEAEKTYHEVLVFDKGNVMAQQGLDAIVMERRHRQILSDADDLFKKGGPQDLEDALEKLRPILSENPNQKDALNLKARINEAKVKQQRPETKLADIYSKPITLEFQDASLKSVFDVISKVSGLNFFFDKDIRPDLKVTVMARNSSLQDAVHLLLVTNQLEQKILNENSILIYPSTPQKLKDYQTLAIRTFYLVNADVKAVSTTIKTILKVKDMVVDERLGIIILRDTPEVIRLAERIVALQDLSDPEVMLEVEILEIKRTKLLQLGIQWPSQLSLAPLTADGAPLTLDALRNLSGATTQATIGSVIINAQKQDTDANLLANPRIRVRNKDKAKILIGDRVPVITTTSTSTGFVSESVTYVDVGLKLEVEPEIYLDEEVAIKVNLEVSSLVKEVQSKSGTLTYQIGTRGANTVLRLKDGETQILAGLINNEERVTANKIPALGEIPILGRLFGSQKNDDQRNEILLSITPRIIRSIRRPDLLAAEFDSGTDTNIGAESLRLNIIQPDKTEVTASADAGTGLAGTPKNPNATNVSPKALPATQTAQSVAGAAVSGNVTFNWKLPAEVKVGEQFSSVLNINSQTALKGLPVLLGYDPQAVQVVNVQEGDYFKQGKGETRFNHRIDAAQGKIFASVVRQNTSGSDSGVNGTGSVLTVTFKALKPTTDPTKLQLISVSPDPEPVTPITVPVEQAVKIVP